MTFRMEFSAATATHRFTLGCSCGARQHWFNEPCYVSWRAKVAREGWKADWPERCPACGPPREPERQKAANPGEHGVLPL